MMKKRKVTYGVYNLIEWLAVIILGKVRFKIPFSGGAVTPQGVTPATYTTTDPITQMAIERSADFKRGKIVVVRSSTLKEDIVIERNPEKPKESDVENNGSSGVDDGDPDDGSAANVAEGGSDDQVGPMNHDEHNGAMHPVDGSEGDECTSKTSAQGGEIPEVAAENAETPGKENVMVFENNDDARDYLESEFGFVRSRLRNRADIIAAGTAHGVTIVFG